RAGGGKTERADRTGGPESSQVRTHGDGPAHRCVPGRKVLRSGRAERIVNHRFSGSRDRSKRTGTGANGGFYLGFLCRFGLCPGGGTAPSVTRCSRRRPLRVRLPPPPPVNPGTIPSRVSVVDSLAAARR